LHAFCGKRLQSVFAKKIGNSGSSSLNRASHNLKDGWPCLEKNKQLRFTSKRFWLAMIFFLPQSRVWSSLNSEFLLQRTKIASARTLVSVQFGGTTVGSLVQQLY